jgi:uncharacterized paraquat-inducible protein A
MKDIQFNCSFCGQSIEAPVDMAGQTTECPTCKKQIVIPNTGEGSAPPPTPNNDAPLPAPAKSKKYWALFLIGIATTLIAQFIDLENPETYAIGGLIAVGVAQLIPYFIILGFLSLIATAIRGGIKKFWFPVLAWLFFISGIVDIVVYSYKEFIMEPRSTVIMEELIRNGKI